MKIKKEINYLSLPDHFNKFLLTNFNEKIDLKDSIIMQFRLSNNYHLGSALKAIYLLEIFFPKKSFVIRLQIKKKKLYFGQKTKTTIYFNFNMTLSSEEFIDFYRFFLKQPFFFKKTNDLFVVNRKLKQFDFNKSVFVVPNKIKFSYQCISLYHLN